LEDLGTRASESHRDVSWYGDDGTECPPSSLPDTLIIMCSLEAISEQYRFDAELMKASTDLPAPMGTHNFEEVLEMEHLEANPAIRGCSKGQKDSTVEKILPSAILEKLCSGSEHPFWRKRYQACTRSSQQRVTRTCMCYSANLYGSAWFWLASAASATDQMLRIGVRPVS
jgi:hypothetical protein